MLSVGSYEPQLSSCGLGKVLPDWVDAQADKCLRRAQMFVLSCSGLFLHIP